jgi:hypothetical protein
MVVFLCAGDPDTGSSDSVDQPVWLGRVIGIRRIYADDDRTIFTRLD